MKNLTCDSSESFQSVKYIITLGSVILSLIHFPFHRLSHNLFSLRSLPTPNWNLWLSVNSLFHEFIHPSCEEQQQRSYSSFRGAHMMDSSGVNISFLLHQGQRKPPPYTHKRFLQSVSHTSARWPYFLTDRRSCDFSTLVNVLSPTPQMLNRVAPLTVNSSCLTPPRDPRGPRTASRRLRGTSVINTEDLSDTVTSREVSDTQRRQMFVDECFGFSRRTA